MHLIRSYIEGTSVHFQIVIMGWWLVATVNFCSTRFLTLSVDAPDGRELIFDCDDGLRYYYCKCINNRFIACRSPKR